LSTGSYPGCHHWRSTPVACPPCRSVAPVESVVGSWSVPVTTAPWVFQSQSLFSSLTQRAAVRIFVGATTAPPQKKSTSSLVSAVLRSSWYQSWAIHGAVLMVVSEPPMSIGTVLGVLVPELSAVFVGVVRPMVPSAARAPAMRLSKVESEGESMDGLAVRVGAAAPAAPADEVITTAATAAATPAATAGRAIRLRRL
jgi:hypothetical protein